MEKKKESLHDILKRVCVCTKKVEEFYKKYDELDDIYIEFISKTWKYGSIMLIFIQWKEIACQMKQNNNIKMA